MEWKRTYEGVAMDKERMQQAHDNVFGVYGLARQKRYLDEVQESS